MHFEYHFHEWSIDVVARNEESWHNRGIDVIEDDRKAVLVSLKRLMDLIGQSYFHLVLDTIVPLEYMKIKAIEQKSQDILHHLKYMNFLQCLSKYFESKDQCHHD